MRVDLGVPLLPLPPPQSRTGYAPRYGADVSFYLPTSARVRRLFGDEWFGIGPAFSPVRIAQRTAFRPDFDLVTQSRSGNDALLAFVGGEVIRSLARPTGYFLPYAGLGAGLLYARADADGVDVNRLTLAGSAFVGTRLGRNAYTEIRYRLTPTLDGLDFSGTSVTVGLRF